MQVPVIESPVTPAIAVTLEDDDDEVGCIRYRLGVDPSLPWQVPSSSPPPSEDILQTPESDSDTMSDVPDLCMDPPDDDDEAAAAATVE